jgi:hypothetical protein
MKQQCDMFPLLPFETHDLDWLYRHYLVAKVVFLGSFVKLLKATISCVMSVRPFVHMEQLGSHWTDFHGIYYLSIFFEKLVKKIQVSSKSDKNKGPLYVNTDVHFFIISRSILLRIKKCFRQKL